MPTPGRGTGYRPTEPVDGLRRAFSGATSSLIPKRYVDPIADAIDSPSLDREPWEAQLRGFGAGAIEGLRQQFSPMNLALAAIPGGRAASTAGRGASAASRAARPTMQVLEEAPAIRQVMPSMDDVGSLVGDLERNLARIPKRRPAPASPAGARDPMLTAVGEEAIYNTGRGGMSRPPSEGFYGDMMRKFGGRAGR